MAGWELEDVKQVKATTDDRNHAAAPDGEVPVVRGCPIGVGAA